MELFEQIRREYEHGSGTIKGVARKLGVHRRMVREAIASRPQPRVHLRRSEFGLPQGDSLPLHAVFPDRILSRWGGRAEAVNLQIAAVQVQDLELI